MAVLIATAGLSQVKVRGEENINGEKNKDDEWKYFVSDIFKIKYKDAKQYYDRLK